jgi:hypothetical protein
MNDCSNAEIRDRLPDLLHELLDAESRAVVIAHVALCVDCRDELELLRSLHKTLNARTPRVDVAYIVSALPKPPAQRAGNAPIQLPRRRWSDWRIAAAVTVLVAGGSSVALLNRSPVSIDVPVRPADSSTNRGVSPVAVVPDTPKQLSPATAPKADQTVAQADAADAPGDDSEDGRFGGLSDAQMQTLLKEIDQLKPVPVTEPEPAAIRVDLKPSGPEGLP